jgi:SAM-dependent methyltransferase
MLAQIVPLTMVDIRPPEVTLDGLYFKEGSILNLPFESNSIISLSSICVTEHIGLGRYGDPLDGWGSEKSFAELIRVLSVGGDLYITVPVDAACKICFNAHRTFTKDYILSNFKSLQLIEEKYQYGMSVVPIYVPALGFGTGYYHFRK